LAIVKSTFKLYSVNNFLKQNLMPYLSSEEKNNLIADLIDLAQVDGNVSMPEMTYLIWVAQKLGVTQEELMHLAKGNRPTYRSTTAAQRVDQFHKMLNLLFVDGKVDAAELEFCKTLAHQLGLDRAKVDAFVAEIEANPTKMLDLDTLKAGFNVA
jgi:uncharacterized tellurite resistance protein B-like protein